MSTVNHDPIDRTPRANNNRQRGEERPFRPDNCQGYTDAEMTTLNAEFEHRWNQGDWPTANENDSITLAHWEAMRAFQTEVNHR